MGLSEEEYPRGNETTLIANEFGTVEEDEPRVLDWDNGLARYHRTDDEARPEVCPKLRMGVDHARSGRAVCAIRSSLDATAYDDCCCKMMRGIAISKRCTEREREEMTKPTAQMNSHKPILQLGLLQTGCSG